MLAHERIPDSPKQVAGLPCQGAVGEIGRERSKFSPRHSETKTDKVLG